MSFYLLGALFLAWNMGRNNLSNAFGTAISTKMLNLHTAAFLSAVCMVLGLFSSGGTVKSVVDLGKIDCLFEAFIICLSASIVLFFLTHYGLPVSICQLTIGAFVGMLIFTGRSIARDTLGQILRAWLICPFFAVFISIFCYYVVRFSLMRFRVHILYRDIIARIGLILVGGMSSYALGSNNISGILGPYMAVDSVNVSHLIVAVACCLALGFFTSSMKVIKTVGNKLFPLSPIQAFVVVLSSGLTMLFFSLEPLRNLFTLFYLPPLPSAPVPLAVILVGSVIGISLTHKGQGINYQTLKNISLSFLFSPVISLGVCYCLMALIRYMGEFDV